MNAEAWRRTRARWIAWRKGGTCAVCAGPVKPSTKGAVTHSSVTHRGTVLVSITHGPCDHIEARERVARLEG